VKGGLRGVIGSRRQCQARGRQRTVKSSLRGGLLVYATEPSPSPSHLAHGRKPAPATSNSVAALLNTITDDNMSKIDTSQRTDHDDDDDGDVNDDDVNDVSKEA